MNFPFLWRGLRPRVPACLHFCSPLPAPARIALLETSFQAGPNMCTGTVEDLPWLRIWAPEVLVLPLDLALFLADQKQRGLFDIPSLNTAIVVLTSIEDSLLADHHRVLLWRAFGLPVFEQLRATDGTAIASECEVHDGLHLVAQFPELMGEIVTDHCACGAETPRLRSLSPAMTKAAAV